MGLSFFLLFPQSFFFLPMLNVKTLGLAACVEATNVLHELNCVLHLHWLPFPFSGLVGDGLHLLPAARNPSLVEVKYKADPRGGSLLEDGLILTPCNVCSVKLSSSARLLVL